MDPQAMKAMEAASMLKKAGWTAAEFSTWALTIAKNMEQGESFEELIRSHRENHFLND